MPLVAVRVLEAARETRAAIFRQPPSRKGSKPSNGPRGSSCCTLADGSRVLLDAAHNPEGARALRDYLARWHPERPALVVGVMRDKDADAILRELLPVTSSVIATAADTPRAMPADELAARVTALDAARSVVASAPTPATRSTRALVDEPNGVRRGIDFPRRRGPRASLRAGAAEATRDILR